MGKKLDLVGVRFGRLTVVGLHGRKGAHRTWLCRCDCGKDVEVATYKLTRTTGAAGSCGCYRLSQLHKALFKHGQKNTRAYQSWCMMINRCENPNAPEYHRYGGRGISICKRWRESFVSFLEDMGQPPPLLTLDRIDNDKGYSKDNCRWADRKTRRRNSSENIIVEVGGKTMCLADAADILGIKRNTLYGRYRRHGDIHRA